MWLTDIDDTDKTKRKSREVTANSLEFRQLVICKIVTDLTMRVSKHHQLRHIAPIFSNVLSLDEFSDFYDFLFKTILKIRLSFSHIEKKMYMGTTKKFTISRSMFN